MIPSLTTILLSETSKEILKHFLLEFAKSTAAWAANDLWKALKEHKIDKTIE